MTRLTLMLIIIPILGAVLAFIAGGAVQEVLWEVAIHSGYFLFYPAVLWLSLRK